MRRTWMLVVTTAVMGLAGLAQAQPQVSIASVPADLSGLHIGQVVHFEVRLSDLAPGQRLDSLLVTVRDDSQLLLFADPVAGELVAGLADPLDFSAFASG